MDSIIVWLDAGHGGFDVGTYVVLDECGTVINEKDIALAIVLKAYELFQKSDSLWNYTATKADLLENHKTLSQ